MELSAFYLNFHSPVFSKAITNNADQAFMILIVAAFALSPTIGPT